MDLDILQGVVDEGVNSARLGRGLLNGLLGIDAILINAKEIGIIVVAGELQAITVHN